MKINSHLNAKDRKYLRKKLRKYPRLHKLTILLQRKYCNLTGSLHYIPNFYIIGVEKGGTSSLYGYLSQHPKILPAVTKEINFFNKYYDRGINWYKVCFPFRRLNKKKTTEIITGEASVRYFDYPHAPKRIKKLTPDAKFIVLLRNPVDRAYSQHSMEVRGGNEKLSFEDAIEMEHSRINGEYEKMLQDKNYYSEIFFKYGYLQRGIYIDSLKHWMSIFPKENFLILQSEEFFKNVESIYHKALEFLNLEIFSLSTYPVFRPQNKNPPIKPTLRRKLIDFYKPHNERLYKFLGYSLDWDQ